MLSLQDTPQHRKEQEFLFITLSIFFISFRWAGSLEDKAVDSDSKDQGFESLSA